MESANTITLLNGSVLECFPKAEQPIHVDNDQMDIDMTGVYLSIDKPKQPDVDVRTKALKEERSSTDLFVQNAFLFYRNADKILSDSKLFLTPVLVSNGLFYTGTSGFCNPTLGIYVEWWLGCESPITQDLDDNEALTWFFAGSPLSGSNKCRCVYPDGSTKEISHKKFLPIWSSFNAINTRYTEAKQRFESYSLEEAIAMLKNE